MLCESSGDHPRLSLLAIFFHFRVTLTAITSGTVHLATCNILCPFLDCQTHPTSCALFSNIMVRKKSSITPNILDPARSDCHATPLQQIMISLLPPPHLKKESV